MWRLKCGQSVDSLAGLARPRSGSPGSAGCPVAWPAGWAGLAWAWLACNACQPPPACSPNSALASKAKGVVVRTKIARPNTQNGKPSEPPRSQLTCRSCLSCSGKDCSGAKCDPTPPFREKGRRQTGVEGRRKEGRRSRGDAKRGPWSTEGGQYLEKIKQKSRDAFFSFTKRTFPRPPISTLGALQP